MTELDADIGPLALELIDEFGKPISYARVTKLGYNPATGTAGGYEDFFPVKAIVEEYNGQSFVVGLVERGDKKLTVAAQAFTDGLPTANDRVELDNEFYSVVGVKTTYSGELPALFELQVRK